MGREEIFMAKQITIAILGCGGRGATYSKHMSKYPDKFKTVALCDPYKRQLEKLHELYGLEDAAEFLDADEFLKEKRADVLIIATPDRQHFEQAIRGMELGYDILLEKPISDSREEIDKLLETQKRTGSRVVVCHELRHGKGFLKCEEILNSGRLGRLYAIDASERVAYWHWAMSYVREPGALLKNGFPGILAKCSHDLDLVQAYAKSECDTVSSIGDLTFFKEENAPEGAADRCVLCKHMETCPYSAKRIYVDDWHKAGEPRFSWPYSKISLQVPLTEEALMKGITEGPLGRCAFKCPTDLVDHQMVQMQFKNGVKASLKMLFGGDVGRRYVFFCTMGELVFDERDEAIVVMPYGEDKEIITEFGDPKENKRGHGGGDGELLLELYNVVTGASAGKTTLKESVECHLMGISAEESRHAGGALVKVHR